MRKVLSLLAGLALAGTLSSCGDGGDNTITSPSELQRNLNTAPPNALEISDAVITVRFWWEFAPPPGSALAPGDPTRIEYHCRANSGANYELHHRLAWVAPDGSPANMAVVSRAGQTTTECAPNNVSYLTGSVGQAFNGLKEIRIASTLAPMAFFRGGIGPSTTANFVFPVNWSVRR